MVAISEMTQEEFDAYYASCVAEENRLKAAIRAGIEATGKTLSELEKDAIEGHVECVWNGHRKPGRTFTDLELEALTESAKAIAEDGLLTNALVAIAFEQSLTDFPVLDGPVGRALDEAIGVLRPLAKNHLRMIESKPVWEGVSEPR